MMNHFSVETLVDYFDELLSASEELAIEEHLADCDPCTATAREVRGLSNLWESWTAETHAWAHQNAAVIEAVGQAVAREEDPAVRARLARWAEHWAGRAAATVRVVLDATGEAARVVTGGIEALARPGQALGLDFAPAAMPEPVRGGPRRPGPPSRPTVAVAPISGTAQARVAISGQQRVVVRVDGLPPEQPPPLVLLAPAAGSGEPRVAVPSRQPGVQYLIARFDNVPPGNYLVVFEPIER
jgi:hypothetical protein